MPYKDPVKQKECQAKYRKSLTKDDIKNTKLKHAYGITLDEYNKMFADQSGCCAICSIHQSEVKVSLVVDHCHTTGAIRGLLCSPCNLAIGTFKDNITTLQNAIKYLGGNNGNE